MTGPSAYRASRHSATAFVFKTFEWAQVRISEKCPGHSWSVRNSVSNQCPGHSPIRILSKCPGPQFRLKASQRELKTPPSRQTIRAD